MGEVMSQRPFSYPGIDPLVPAPAPELVIGIVSPAGSRRATLVELIQNELKEYGYGTQHIKLSDLISLVPKHKNIHSDNTEEPGRTIALMDAGNEVRMDSGLGDALAILAITEIKNRREAVQDFSNAGTGGDYCQRVAYILDSLKHPDEVNTLRSVYGQGFQLVSGYSRREIRVKNLAARIASSKCDPQGIDGYKSDAEKIVQRDSNEATNKLGQKVQSCFPLADFFVDLDFPGGEQKRVISRYLEVLFDNPFVTPARDEVGMFHAEAASWRSSDLSRQVGAAICNSEGNVLSVGCNEAPRAHGGLYWEGDAGDGRDFQRGRNEGGEQKRLVVAEIFERMSQDERFATSGIDRLTELRNKVIKGCDDPVLEGLQALNVIEYGRTVHAEMAALSDAAARGVPVKGATMYVNTFPCHLCARHVVAAGIQRVVYVEPYPKSLVATLFDDSVVVEPEPGGAVKDKVVFEAFTGVAPRAYRFSFCLTGRRKDATGRPVRWRKAAATTKMKRYVPSYLAMENLVINGLAPGIRGDIGGEGDEG